MIFRVRQATQVGRFIERICRRFNVPIAERDGSVVRPFTQIVDALMASRYYDTSVNVYVEPGIYYEYLDIGEEGTRSVIVGQPRRHTLLSWGSGSKRLNLVEHHTPIVRSKGPVVNVSGEGHVELKHLTFEATSESA